MCWCLCVLVCVGVLVDLVASVSHVVAQLLDDMTARVHYLS